MQKSKEKLNYEFYEWTVTSYVWLEKYFHLISNMCHQRPKEPQMWQSKGVYYTMLLCMYIEDIVLEDDDDDDDKNLLTRVKMCEMAIRLMLIIQ